MRRLDPAGGGRNQYLVQALGPVPEQAQPPQQHHARDGVGGLHQAGAGKVVVHEPLGAEPGQQALREALLQVQVHGVVAEHPGILEDHRPDRRLAPPLGELLAGLAGRAQGVQGGGPTRMEQAAPRRSARLAGAGASVRTVAASRGQPGSLPAAGLAWSTRDSACRNRRATA